MSQQTIEDVLKNTEKLRKEIDELNKKINNNNRMIENKFDVNGDSLSDNDIQFNLLTQSIREEWDGQYQSSRIIISNIDIDNQDTQSLQNLYNITLEKYKSEQFKIFGHKNDINSIEWRKKCNDRSLDPKRLSVLSDLKALMLEDYYYLFIKPTITPTNNGKYIYLTECKNDRIRYFDTMEEAFDAKCNECKLPPYIFVKKVNSIWTDFDWLL